MLAVFSGLEQTEVKFTALLSLRLKKEYPRFFHGSLSAWWRVKRHLLLTPSNIRFLLLIADISPS